MQYKTLNLNGIDFLMMVKNGSLTMEMDDKGNINGITLDDDMVNKFDGLLVALQKHTQLLMESTYTVVVKEDKINQTPQIETSENQNIIED